MLTAIGAIASSVAAEDAGNCLILKGLAEPHRIRRRSAFRGGESMRLAFFVSVSLLSGCVSNGVHPLRPLEIATAPYRGITTTALTGTLMYEGGCLLFRDDENRLHLYPVWPDGSTFNGTSITFHEPGRADQRVVLNEEFLMEGQPLQWSSLPGPRFSVHQSQCGAQPFAVLGVHPAN
jgi:hypothetical protein